jgi:RNA polymerase sigma-70 factor (ECF subfamily)
VPTDSETGSEFSDLIARIAQRDQLGLAELYDRTSSVVFGLARRILNNIPSAEDVTQEVYLQVWREAGQYNATRGTPLSWLRMLARTRAIDCLRTLKKHENEQPLGSYLPIADGSRNAEEQLAVNGRRAIVLAAIEMLSPAQRQAIELSFYSGLSHGEIALKLGLPLGTVKTHIRLGMLRLRDRLRPHRGNL